MTCLLVIIKVTSKIKKQYLIVKNVYYIEIIAMHICILSGCIITLVVAVLFLDHCSALVCARLDKQVSLNIPADKFSF